jgi:hypothetical protein
MELNGTTGRTLFRLDASIRVEGSHGRAIADIPLTAYPTPAFWRHHSVWVRSMVAALMGM